MIHGSRIILLRRHLNSHPYTFLILFFISFFVFLTSIAARFLVKHSQKKKIFGAVSGGTLEASFFDFFV